jgi:hypothetical protein
VTLKLTDVSEVRTASINRRDDVGSTHLWNVGQLNVTTRRYSPEDSKLHMGSKENIRIKEGLNNRKMEQV